MKQLSLTHWSLICLGISILSWLPNFIFDYGFSYWIAGQAFGAIAFVLAIIGKNWWLVVPTFIMANSFFIFMAVGYYFLGP
jgi:hypothetical protein